MNQTTQMHQISRHLPEYAAAHFNLGNALSELGRTAEAAAAFRAALRIKPDYVKAHYNLGNVLREDGRLDEAVAAYQQAIVVVLRAPEPRASPSRTVSA